MFLLEYEHTGKLIRELEEKTRIAENQLQEAKDAHSRTKDEYERLEKSLEELNQRMDALREESRDRAIRKQQLSGESMSFMNRSLQVSRMTAIIAAAFWPFRKTRRKNPQTERNWKSRGQICRQSFAEVSRELSDEQEKLDNIRATSKNVPRQ